MMRRPDGYLSPWLLTALIATAPLLMGHHPAFPTPLDFAPFPDDPDPDEWAIVATPGFVSSQSPQGYSCKEAFGVDGRLYGAALGHSHYAMLSDEGLAVTFDGCNLDEVHPVDGWLVDLDSHGSDRIAAITSRDGGDHIYVSDDGGETLDEPLVADDDYRLTSVEWIDEDRIAVAAYDEDRDNYGAAHLLEVSAVDETIEYHSLADDLHSPFILAADADTVVIATRIGGFETTLILAWGPPNQPDRHRAELEAWPMDADVHGDQAYIAPLKDDWDNDWAGVGRADSQGQLHADERLEDHDSRCVVGDDGGFWVCSSGYAESYGLWRVDDGHAPEPFYRLAELDGPRADCADDSDVAEICPEYWELVAPEIPHRSQDTDDPPPDDTSGGTGTRLPDDQLPDWHDDVFDDAGDRDAESSPDDGSDDSASDRDAACHQSPGSTVPYIGLVLLGLLVGFPRLSGPTS